MKNLKNITCPNCLSRFEIKSAIWNDIKSTIEQELNQEILNQKKELQKKKDEYTTLTFRLSKEKADFDKLVQQQVAKNLLTEGKSLRKKIEEEINQKKEKELDELQSKLISKTKEISGLNKLKRKMAIEAEEKEAKIIMKYDAMLEEKLKEVKLSVQNQSTEKHKLEIMQKEKLISDLKAQLDITQRKIEQNSSQLIGEVQELRLEALLEDTFGELGDKVVPIGKGISGADCYLEVSAGQNILGRILFESKATRSFSNKWLTKLHEDNKNSINAEVCILITRTMPKGFEQERYTIIDNIFICRMDFVKTMTTLVRYFLYKSAQIQMKYKGKSDKEHILFSYITSAEFENFSKSVLGQLESLKNSMDAEKQKLVKLYQEREQMIEKAIMSMTEYFGSINGIITRDDNHLKALPKAS